VAASEAAVAIAIIINIYRNFKSIDVENLDQMKFYTTKCLENSSHEIPIRICSHQPKMLYGYSIWPLKNKIYSNE
jgi:hypothetical protein